MQILNNASAYNLKRDSKIAKKTKQGEQNRSRNKATNQL